MVRIKLTKAIPVMASPFRTIGSVLGYARRVTWNTRKLPAFQPGSVAGRILYDLYNGKRKDDEFKRIKKELLNKFSIKNVGKIQKKYIGRRKNPEELEKELEELGKEFKEAIKSFINSYIETFQTFEATFNEVHATEYNSLAEFNDILTATETIANNPDTATQLHFPKEIVKRFSKEFKFAIDDLYTQLKKTHVTVSKLSRNPRYALNYFSRFVRKRVAEREGMNAAERLKEELLALRNASDAIMAQIRPPVPGPVVAAGPPKIKKTFLSYLIAFVERFEDIDNTMKGLKGDMEIILDKTLLESYETLEKLEPFIDFIEPDIPPADKAEIDTLLNTFRDDHAKLKKEIGDMDEWPKLEVAVLGQIKTKGNRIIQVIVKAQGKGLEKRLEARRKQYRV